MLSSLNSVVPGYKDCEVALKEIERLSYSLNVTPNDPSTGNATPLVEQLNQASKNLAVVTGKIVSSARMNPEAAGKAALSAVEASELCLYCSNF